MGVCDASLALSQAGSFGKSEKKPTFSVISEWSWQWIYLQCKVHTIHLDPVTGFEVCTTLGIIMKVHHASCRHGNNFVRLLLHYVTVERKAKSSVWKKTNRWWVTLKQHCLALVSLWYFHSLGLQGKIWLIIPSPCILEYTTLHCYNMVKIFYTE